MPALVRWVPMHDYVGLDLDAQDMMSEMSMRFEPIDPKSSMYNTQSAHHLVGLDAREVQDVRDEHEQRLAAAADGVDQVKLQRSTAQHVCQQLRRWHRQQLRSGDGASQVHDSAGAVCH